MKENNNIEDIFGIQVFNESVMRERLPKETYIELEKSIQEGAPLQRDTADVVASVMKDWAIENGATHYTHWFQPLTGVTAEKHDSFIEPTDDGHTIMKFSGKELTKGESDASSFPSGGLRATFEARGYTAWDCTSPAFLKEDAIGTILCIPTAFCTYNGEALDRKTPLLRSMDVLNRETLRLLRILGNTTTQKVTAMAGAEQEYFLIDREKYHRRKDIVYTGRTLFGSMPAKGQEMADHYSGSISERTGAFMKALNEELWKLGVPAKTQHNEAAPGQHEIAPVYTTANVATDQNQLIMETLKKVAARQGLACLLHEKPFEGINGSGKHNNWSIVTDDGVALLYPGSNLHDNTQFLLLLTCILKAVDEHADLLRLSSACAGNDYRLGGNEAPPAIISVFVGEQIQDVLDQIISSGQATHSIAAKRLATGVSYIPQFHKDTTDRNRTSPFAFTGNRFEFRAVGSSDSIASANTVLNTIAAEAFGEAADILEEAEDVQVTTRELICRYATEHQRIIFNGNGYSEEWRQEAKRRGLPELKNMVEAVSALENEKNIAMFEKLGVLSRAESSALTEIRYETYVKQMHIESHAMLNITNKQLIPAVIGYATELARSINSIRGAWAGADVSTQQERLETISTLLSKAHSAESELAEVLERVEAMKNVRAKAYAYENEVRTLMDSLRSPLDELEKLMDKKHWPFPSYGDMLFDV